MNNNLPDSLYTLLAEIVDYAGLFPPSKVSMAVAVQNYSQYLKSEHSWMLGRFVVPISNLDKFIKEATPYIEENKIWLLSGIAGEDVVNELRKVLRFNKKYEDKILIDTVEIKADSTETIYEATKVLTDEVTAYFEIPQTEVLTEYMTALALTKNRAKIRTGGLTQEAFPSTDAIIKFMRVCIAANVPFKATAGLHHPLRCVKPLTYEENAIKGTMHGFLNLFLSAAFLRNDLNNSFVHKLMNEYEADDLKFENERIIWKDHSIDLKTIKLLREKNAISFGSCSFLEPIEDLQQLAVIS